MSNVIKILLAALLFGCLQDVPYGYFQFVRVGGCLGFIYLAYKELLDTQMLTGLFSVTCAVLLNPIWKIHFTRGLWNKIDAVIAIILLVWLIIDLNSHYVKGNKKGFN